MESFSPLMETYAAEYVEQIYCHGLVKIIFPQSIIFSISQLICLIRWISWSQLEQGKHDWSLSKYPTYKCLCSIMTIDSWSVDCEFKSHRNLFQIFSLINNN